MCCEYRRARELIMNIVQTRGGPRDAGPPSVESLGGQHSVSIDLTLAPNVSIRLSRLAPWCNPFSTLIYRSR